MKKQAKYKKYKRTLNLFAIDLHVTFPDNPVNTLFGVKRQKPKA